MTKTILMIDPDPSMSQLLRAIFAQTYKFTTATSLPEALKRLSSSHFDLVLTESLSFGRGFDFDPSFLAPLKAASGDTPIILFSAYAWSLPKEATSYGLVGAIPKPADLEEIVQKVTDALGDSPPAHLSTIWPKVG